MPTHSEKNFLDGAAIGIAAAMASSKINKPSSNGRVNYKKLEENAQAIAEAFFGQPVPEAREAIEGYIESMRGDIYGENTTFADLVAAMETSNNLATTQLQKEKELAEAEMPFDIVAMSHIENHAAELIDTVSKWQEMEYEHDRQVKSIHRPSYKEALSAARASAIEAGYYDEEGNISYDYIDKIRAQVMEERHNENADASDSAASDDNAPAIEGEIEEREQQLPQRLNVSENAGSSDGANEDGADNENVIEGKSEAVEENEEDVTSSDNFFAQIAEKLEHSLHDMRGIDIMADSYDDDSATVVLPVIGAAAGKMADFEDDETKEEENVKVDIPSNEVLEILEPDPVKDPTVPIVMEPSVIAEALAEEASEIPDDTLVAEVADAMVEEMEEAAELDVDECKSFTDQFMVVEIGPDGHAHAHAEMEDDKPELPDNDETNNDLPTAMEDCEVTEATESASASGTEQTASLDTEAITEEILAISAKTRENIKNFVDKK